MCIVMLRCTIRIELTCLYVAPNLVQDTHYKPVQMIVRRQFDLHTRNEQRQHIVAWWFLLPFFAISCTWCAVACWWRGQIWHTESERATQIEREKARDKYYVASVLYNLGKTKATQWCEHWICLSSSDEIKNYIFSSIVYNNFWFL